MKTCTKCKKEKNLNDFYKNKTYKDGYQNTCKQCHKAVHKIPGCGYYDMRCK